MAGSKVVQLSFVPQNGSVAWVDFTRRNDPACPEALEYLKKTLQAKKPGVFCFWTKAPDVVANLYADVIRQMRSEGVLVLCQATINRGYKLLEPGVHTEYQELGKLIELLGGPQYVRARFDPVIFGYTAPSMFEEHCRFISSYGVDYTVVNFYVPHYKHTAEYMRARGIKFDPNPSWDQQDNCLATVAEIAHAYGVRVAVCAETVAWAGRYGLLPARCSDPTWAVTLRPDLAGAFQKHPSRKGCGCVYSEDWGIYRNQGGWRCPHQCLYCYAK